MKRIVVLLFALFIGVTSFAQKNELKAAEKAIKKNDLATAQASIKQAMPLIENADDKTKAKFYYLQAMTCSGLAKADPSKYSYAAEAYNNLFEVEKKMHTTKYTKLAQPELDKLISDISAKGIKSYQDKNYTAAKDQLFEVYHLSPRDTVFLEYAANAAYLDKDYDKALKYFVQLKDLGYTGISTEYSALNKDTGKREVFESKAQMELMKKSKLYSEFKETKSESKRPTIIKNISYVYVDMGDNEKAIEAIREARRVDPKDVSLIMNEANLQIKLGDKEAFASLMNEAIALDPNNPTLYYNLGVINNEQKNYEKAKEYYKKAIELNPEYTDAYVNLGAVLLLKDQDLVEEMNKNLNDFDKYDKIKAKQVTLYKEVIPYYEKAYKFKPDDIDIVRTLMSLYENVDMETEFKEMKAKYDTLK
jgi:tetratricopeptide (TPR) repeat protein